MRDWRLVATGLSGLAAISCGGDGGGGGDGGVVETMPACVDSYLALKGMLDGQALDATVPYSSSQFQQVQQPYTFDIAYEDVLRGTMHLEWTTLLPIDAPPVSVTGIIDMPTGAPYDGLRMCVGRGSLKEVDTSGGSGTANEFRFTLEMLSSGNGCGAPSTGVINGCIKG